MRLVVKDMYRSQQGVQLVEGWISFFLRQHIPQNRGYTLPMLGE